MKGVNIQRLKDDFNEISMTMKKRNFQKWVINFWKYIKRSLRAYHNLLYIFDKLDCKIKMKLELFDKMVTPILHYGSEVWGIYCIKEIDKLHIKFCKYVLGVKTQTSNFAV